MPDDDCTRHFPIPQRYRCTALVAAALTGLAITPSALASGGCKQEGNQKYASSDAAHQPESWEASSDAKNWSFKIRKGVMFSNGKELTAADCEAFTRFDYRRMTGKRFVTYVLQLVSHWEGPSCWSSFLFLSRSS